MNLFSPKWPLERPQSSETFSNMYANLSSPAALAAEQDPSIGSLQVLSQNAALSEKQHVDVKAEVLRKLTRLDAGGDGDSGGWGSWTASSESNQ